MLLLNNKDREIERTSGGNFMGNTENRFGIQIYAADKRGDCGGIRLRLS